MAGPALIAYGGLIVVAVVVVWVATRRVGHVRLEGEALCEAVRAAKRRFLIAVGFTGFLLLIGFAGTIAFPATLGLPLAVAPGVAYAAGLLLYALTPPPSNPITEEVHVRVASLEPRGLWSFMPGRILVGLVALFVATFALLLCTGITSSPDEAGRYRAITFSDAIAVSSATPYAGWYYAIPLLGGLILLAAAVSSALRRVATTSSLPGAGLEHQDRAWRVASTRVVLTLAASALSLHFGGVAVISGSAIHNALSQSVMPMFTRVVGDVLFTVGLAALGASLVWFTLAALRALGLPHTVAHEVATQDATIGANNR